jgi:hypothetical protein
MRFIPLCVAALLLAGCANSTMTGTQSVSRGSPPRPTTVVVSDFVFASDVVALDRGFTARLERKIGSFPTHERKQRTAERVNDEIVATMVATLRETGLDAQPGSEEGLSLNDDALVVSGRLRAIDQGNRTQRNDIGFGAGRSDVVADMTVLRLSGGGKKQLLNFTAQAQSGRKPGAAVTAPVAATRGAAIAAALAAGGAAAEKLSADVEAQARKLGRAAGEKIVAYAQEQGWLEKADATAAPPEEKPAKKLEKKPAKPEAKEKPET